MIKIRHAMPSRTLKKAEFEPRFKSDFIDFAYENFRHEIDQIAAIEQLSA